MINKLLYAKFKYIGKKSSRCRSLYGSLHLLPSTSTSPLSSPLSVSRVGKEAPSTVVSVHGKRDDDVAAAIDSSIKSGGALLIGHGTTYHNPVMLYILPRNSSTLGKLQNHVTAVALE